MNISHDLGAVAKTAPVHKPEKQQYSDVLKKTVSPAQLKRLKKRAAARAEEAKTETLQQKKIAEKPLEDAEKADHVSELQKVEAAKAAFEVHGLNTEVEKTMAIAEAEKAISDNAYKMSCAEAEKSKID